MKKQKQRKKEEKKFKKKEKGASGELSESGQARVVEITLLNSRERQEARLSPLQCNSSIIGGKSQPEKFVSQLEPSLAPSSSS